MKESYNIEPDCMETVINKFFKTYSAAKKFIHVSDRNYNESKIKCVSVDEFKKYY